MKWEGWLFSFIWKHFGEFEKLVFFLEVFYFQTSSSRNQDF